MNARKTTIASASVAAAVVCFASVAQAKPNWELVYSSPNQGNAITAITAIDGSHGWAVGIEGGGGNSQPVGLRTIDGSNWSPMMLPPQIAMLQFYFTIAFANADVGWLAGFSGVGMQPRLWRTDNGGMSWAELAQPAAVLEHLQALPTGQLYGAGGNAVVVSVDGQQVQSVTPTVPGGMDLKTVHMLNPDCGFVVAASDSEAVANSAVLWSGDGGSSWEVRAQDLAYRISRLWFVSASQGWAAATDRQDLGVVLHTTDGGVSWSPQAIPDHPPYGMVNQPSPVTSCQDVRFFDDLRGLALCLACTGGCDGDQPSYLTAFMRTADGGASWQHDPDYEPQMSAPPFGAMMVFSGMFNLAFPEPNAGFMAGQNNLILRYAAADPEPAGWAPPSCDPGASGNGGGSGTGAGGPGIDGDAPGGEDDSGCGCRLAGADGQRAGWLALGLLALGVSARRRRSV